MATPGHHTLSVLVANKPGVLSRVSGLFSRRGFNIESLAVGPTERHDRSVITIRVDCTKHSVDQVAKQLDKLIDVIDVIEVQPDMAIERELLLIGTGEGQNLHAVRTVALEHAEVVGVDQALGVLDRLPIDAIGRDIYDSRRVERSVYELQTAVRPGNSGGPFVLDTGLVAGVVFAASSTDDGIGYAIASTEVLPWVEVALGQTVAVSTLTCTA